MVAFTVSPSSCKSCSCVLRCAAGRSLQLCAAAVVIKTVGVCPCLPSCCLRLRRMCNILVAPSRVLCPRGAWVSVKLGCCPCLQPPCGCCGSSVKTVRKSAAPRGGQNCPGTHHWVLQGIVRSCRLLAFVATSEQTVHVNLCSPS